MFIQTFSNCQLVHIWICFVVTISIFPLFVCNQMCIIIIMCNKTSAVFQSLVPVSITNYRKYTITFPLGIEISTSKAKYSICLYTMVGYDAEKSLVCFPALSFPSVEELLAGWASIDESTITQSSWELSLIELTLAFFDAELNSESILFAETFSSSLLLSTHFELSVVLTDTLKYHLDVLSSSFYFHKGLVQENTTKFE